MNVRQLKQQLSSTPWPPFVPRFPKLQELNGKLVQTSCSLDYACVPKSVKEVLLAEGVDVVQTLLNGKIRGVRLGKFLLKKGVSEAEISATFHAKAPGVQLTFSTRYKDFLRSAQSRHYKTCAGTHHPNTMPYYLSCPETFLLIHRDPGGDFDARHIGRLVAVNTVKSELAFVFNKGYGIRTSLPSKIFGYPCYMFSSSEKGAFQVNLPRATTRDSIYDDAERAGFMCYPL
jgi:hypothetical protein